MEQTARGETRGFYVVSFDTTVQDVKFLQHHPYEIDVYDFDVSTKNATRANSEIIDYIQQLDVENKIVLIKIKGELSGGKTSAIKTTQLKSILLDNGAIFVDINRYGLTSKEFSAVRGFGDDIPAIETTLFKHNIGAIQVNLKRLQGGNGVTLASRLLTTLRTEIKASESRKDYTSRQIKTGIATLELTEAFE
jgi:hypothetical protein